jgi:hypothetical protein
MVKRAFMVAADRYDTSALLLDWQWLVPEKDTPLFLTVMADWVFGSPDGSIWRLSVLEGNYVRIALDAEKYNTLKKSVQWLDEEFSAGWQSIGAGAGLKPNDMECLGWRLHPCLGGELMPNNLQIFSMLVYQSLMGQLHKQMQKPANIALSERPWWKLW